MLHGILPAARIEGWALPHCSPGLSLWQHPTMVPGPSTSRETHRTGAVVAVKDLSRAKSRLGALPAALRGRLASLMAVTVIRALSEVVDDVVVVTTAPGIGPLLTAYGVAARIVADPRAGLNAAFEAGETVLRGHGCALVVACMADLPTLSGESVRAALAPCTGRGRWFVRDAAGTGTTLLAAHDADLMPAFGSGSAARHAASGAQELRADARLRLDVDELPDLEAAAALGVGHPVTALLPGGQIGRHTTGVIADADRDGWTIVTAAGGRAYAPASALSPDVRRLTAGQRVHLVREAAGTVGHVWI